MRTLLLPCLAFCSLAVSGCSAVYTTQPLYTDLDNVEEPALVGTWVFSGDEETDFCFEKSDHREYLMYMTSPKSKLVQVYQVNLVRLGDDLYLDVVFNKQKVGDTEIDDPLGTISHHVIAKVDIADDDLAYTVMDPSAIDKLNKEVDPPLEYITANDVMLVTSPTDVLRRYILIYADKLFPEPDHLKRRTTYDDFGLPIVTCNPVSSP